MYNTGLVHREQHNGKQLVKMLKQVINNDWKLYQNTVELKSGWQKANTQYGKINL